MYRRTRHTAWIMELFNRLALGMLLGVWTSVVSAGVSPQEVVRQASEQVLDKLQAEESIKNDPQRLYEVVDKVLLTHMDFRRMSRWVLGKYWRRTSAEQQARFVEEFRTLLVRTYATALAGYSGQEIHFLPLREDDEDRVTVRTEIEQPSGPAISVAYSLHNKDGDWKAYDVSIDGISMVANYRSTFSAEIRNGGVEHLIQSMAARNRQASNSL